MDLLDLFRRIPPFRTWISRLFHFFVRHEERYMGRIEVFIIIALFGYIIGLAIFLLMLW